MVQNKIIHRISSNFFRFLQTVFKMSLKEISVLIIDDTTVNIMLLQTILKQSGYKVFTAKSGPEGRKIAIEEQPGIILLDVIMPEEDGFETCQKLKENAATADIPIVFISSLKDTKNIVKGLTVGGIDYISKPFQREEVLARVKNYLKLRHTYLRVIEEQAGRLKQIQDAQQSILVNPADIPEAQFGIYYHPIHEAGGDFYDVFEISSGVFGYFIADISGHDLAASYTTSALKALIRQNSSPLYTPDETLRMVNSVLLNIFQTGQYLTAAYACLNRNTCRLSLVNAAHLPILIHSSDGSLNWLESEGDILGVFDSATFHLTEVDVTPGDRIFVFSDGLLESFEQPKRSREEGMQELEVTVESTGDQTIEEATQYISKEMFKGGRTMEDDVVLLGIEV